MFDEDALRSAKAWHYAHLHRICEVVLPTGREFASPAKAAGFFKNMKAERVAEVTNEASSSSTSVALEQEATPVKSSVAKDCCVDRPNVAIRVHKVPRQRMYVPTVNEEGVPHVPTTAIDVTRHTRTNLGNADENEIDDVWCGDEGDVRELPDFWVGETVFNKLHNSPPGCEIIWGRPTREQNTARRGDIWPEMWKLMGTKYRGARR